MTPAPLATARLDLEPLAADHADAALPIFADPETYRYMTGEPRTDPVTLRAYFARLAAGSGRATEWWLNWMVFERETRRCVGWMQATVIGAREASIAYVIAVPRQRRGYAREAAAAMVDWLWELPTLDTIVAQADVSNLASQRVAEALGFVRDPGDVASELRGEATRDAVYRRSRSSRRG